MQKGNNKEDREINTPLSMSQTRLNREQTLKEYQDLERSKSVAEITPYDQIGNLTVPEAAAFDEISGNKKVRRGAGRSGAKRDQLMKSLRDNSIDSFAR